MDDLAVVLACDGAYVPWAFCLLEEIARRHPGLPLILASEAPLDLPLTLPSLRTVVVENPFRGALPESRHGMAAYLRLVLPDRLAGEARRLLYLDCDTWPLGNLSDAARVDLRGRLFGAVRDNQQWRTPTRRLAEHKALGRPALPYLNSGVLLVDTEPGCGTARSTAASGSCATGPTCSPGTTSRSSTSRWRGSGRRCRPSGTGR